MAAAIVEQIKTIALDLDWNSYATQCGAAAVAGVISHLLYFIRGEHHTVVFQTIYAYMVATVALAAYVVKAKEFAVVDSILTTFALLLSYFLGLYASIGLYRAFLHPLRKFRGPFGSRLSNLYHSSLLGNYDNYRVMKKMHEEYGDFVRTGPMNLSVSVPEAVQIVLGSESKCFKTDWYETSLPLVNLHTIRDKKIHEKRRKVFSRAFSPQALRDYEPRVNMHAEEFINQIKAMKGKSFRGDRWFKYFAYDVMGELAFGESFGMLTAEENRWVPDLLEAGMEDIGYLQPVPWATLLLHNIPFTAKGAKSFLNFVGDQVAKRSAKKGEKLKPDIFSYLLEDYEKSPKKDIDYQWLRGDTRLTIVGGSDTTASTLCYIFYYLAKDPSQIAKLRAELEPLLAGGKTHLETKDVVNAKHLNGVIHEALRLNPPIPSGYPRLTPPEGIVINGTYIPGNTTVVVPLYTIGHSEAAYVRAEEFIPERWYSQPELMKFKNETFASFSLGPYSCIGRALSLMEIRNLIIYILKAFNTIELAPGDDGEAMFEKSKDHFTIGIGPINLRFDNR